MPTPAHAIRPTHSTRALVPHKRLDAFISLAMVLLVALLIAAGCISLAASFLSFSFAQAQISRFGGMRGSTSIIFTDAVFQGVVERARVGAAALFGVAIGLVFGRWWIHRYLCGALGDLPALWADISSRAHRFIVSEDRIHLVALAFISVCGGMLRLAFLSQPIRYDEANMFLGVASAPLYIGLSKSLNNNNHLLNTLLTHFSFVLFGDAPWAIRLPAFVAGAMVVPTAYFATRALYGRYVALITAGLVAGSSVLIEFSTNSRGYSLVCCISLVILALAVYLLRNPRPAGFLLLGLLAGLGFYAMLIMLYPFGIIMLWLLLLGIWPGGTSIERPRIRDLATSVGAAAVTTLMLYTPVFVVSGVASVVASAQLDPWRTATSLEVFPRLPGSIAVMWGMWSRDVPVALQGLLLAGFAGSIVFVRRLSIVRIPLIVAVVAWLLGVLLLQRVVPYERVWIFLLPLFLGMAVAGGGALLTRLAPRSARYTPAVATGLALVAVLSLGAIGLTTQSVYYSEETGTLRDAEGITTFLRDQLQPGDKVLATETSEAPLYYYFRRSSMSFDYFARQSADLQGLTGRLIVVVNESTMRHQTLDIVLSQVGWRTTGDASASIVLRKYDTATIYNLGPGDLQPVSSG